MLSGRQEDKDFFMRMIPTYASVLVQHLRSELTRLELDAADHPELKHLDGSKHMPNQIANMIFERIDSLYREGVIKAEQLILLKDELQSFTDICGGCERIKNTPIPFAYSIFLKKFIFFYVMTLPFSFAFSLGYIAIPVVAFIFYVLASLELLAEEIEDPFGGDENDLPVDKIASGIKKHVEELLG